MKKLLLLLLLIPNLVVGEGNFNGLNCNWIPIKLETTKLKNFFVEITTYDCNHVVHKNLTLQQNASILDTKKNILFKSIASWGEVGADTVKIVNIPEGFPYLAIFESSNPHANTMMSDVLHIFYKGKQLQEVAVLYAPIMNLYPSNNRVGSEPYKIRNEIRNSGKKVVDGFYVSGGKLRIDSLSIKDGSVCTACREFMVETHELQGGKLVHVNLRDYDFETYKPLK